MGSPYSPAWARWRRCSRCGKHRRVSGRAFTLVAVVRRVFAAALGQAGRLLRINDSSVSALILSLANSLAAILMIHEMDDRGRLLNIAFLTSAGCALGTTWPIPTRSPPSSVRLLWWESWWVAYRRWRLRCSWQSACPSRQARGSRLRGVPLRMNL